MSEKQRRLTPGTARKSETRPRPHRVADEPVAEADALGASVQNPLTRNGLPVEEQIRKEWDAKKKGGLPTSWRQPIR